MKFKVKCIGFHAGGKMICIINDHDARELGVYPLDRVVISNKSKKITSIINTTHKTVNRGEIYVYDEIKDILNLKSNKFVDVEPREELESKSYITKKIDGEELNQKEMDEIVKDTVKRNLSDLELASFITALHINGMSLDESTYLSKSMLKTSKTIKFPGIVVDKHSIGGIPGDKTSMIVVPIIASLGLTMPKTSSRSITSPAGTADRMEILAPVTHSMRDIKKIVKKCGGCLVWGGAVDLAPADDLFIQIEHPLALDPMLLPSVMSKKKSVGSKYLVIDIPCGPHAKIKNKKDAEKLARNFIDLGKELDIKVDCAITHGDEPIGNAMGPSLEAREALETLMGKGPSDLVDKATSIAGIVLEMVGKGNKKTALDALKSGKAEKKMREIIKAQGGNQNIKSEDIPYAPYKKVLVSKKTGIVTQIDTSVLAKAAWIAGAPKDKLAGIVINKKIEDPVEKDEVLLTVYSERKEKLNEAMKILKENDVFILIDHIKVKMLIEKM